MEGLQPLENGVAWAVHRERFNRAAVSRLQGVSFLALSFPPPRRLFAEGLILRRAVSAGGEA